LPSESGWLNNAILSGRNLDYTEAKIFIVISIILEGAIVGTHKDKSRPLRDRESDGFKDDAEVFRDVRRATGARRGPGHVVVPGIDRAGNARALRAVEENIVRAEDSNGTVQNGVRMLRRAPLELTQPLYADRLARLESEAAETEGLGRICLIR